MCSPAMVPPQLRPHLSLLLFDRANPSPIPLSLSSRSLSVNGFHRRGPHSLGRSSPFLPLSRFLSVSLLLSLRSWDLSVFLLTLALLGAPRGLADWLAVRLTACPTANPPASPLLPLLLGILALPPLPFFALLSWSFRLFYTPLGLHFPSSISFSFSFWFSLAP